MIKEQDADGLFSDKANEQAVAITALDMAGANYDETKAVQGLMEMAEGGHYKDVIETAYVMIALSKHRDE